MNPWKLPWWPAESTSGFWRNRAVQGAEEAEERLITAFPCFCCTRPMTMLSRRTGWCGTCEVLEERDLALRGQLPPPDHLVWQRTRGLSADWQSLSSSGICQSPDRCV